MPKVNREGRVASSSLRFSTPSRVVRMPSLGSVGGLALDGVLAVRSHTQIGVDRLLPKPAIG